MQIDHLVYGKNNKYCTSAEVEPKYRSYFISRIIDLKPMEVLTQLRPTNINQELGVN